MQVFVTSALSALCVIACGRDVELLHSDATVPGDVSDATPTITSDPLHGLPTGVAAWQEVCAHGYGDAVTAAFCTGGAPPPLQSLRDLEQLVGLVPAAPGVAVAFAAESASIGMRHVTQLVPRAFVFTAPHADATANASFAILAFARGEPYVELVASDPVTRAMRFFLVRFALACEPHCSFADLLTPAIETGWTGYSLYDDELVKNTTLDCRACHQPNGPGTPAIPRMQELTDPWDHWLYDNHASGRALIDDFLAAHATESYAGIPVELVRPTRPELLEQLLVNNGYGTQPNAFDSSAIERELAATGASATWSAIYGNAMTGAAIAVPYFGVPHTDPIATMRMIAAYQQAIAGTLPRDQLPDVRETFADAALAAMSIRPAPGLDGRGVLHHMCGSCHNARLDHAITRGQFDVDRLDELPVEEKQLAIARLMLPDADIHKMPPPRYHGLTPDEIARVVAALQE